MPIYEYRCGECGEKFERFVRTTGQQTPPTCPRCGSQHVQKSLSLFGVGGAREGATATVAASCGSGQT